MAFRAAETKPGLSDIFHVISREDYGSKGLHVVERLLLNSAVKLHRKKIHRVGIPVPSPPIAKLGGDKLDAQSQTKPPLTFIELAVLAVLPCPGIGIATET